jgi:hypothetical protein
VLVSFSPFVHGHSTPLSLSNPQPDSDSSFIPSDLAIDSVSMNNEYVTGDSKVIDMLGMIQRRSSSRSRKALTGSCDGGMESELMTV